MRIILIGVIVMGLLDLLFGCKCPTEGSQPTQKDRRSMEAYAVLYPESSHTAEEVEQEAIARSRRASVPVPGHPPFADIRESIKQRAAVHNWRDMVLDQWTEAGGTWKVSVWGTFNDGSIAIGLSTLQGWGWYSYRVNGEYARRVYSDADLEAAIVDCYAEANAGCKSEGWWED